MKSQNLNIVTKGELTYITFPSLCSNDIAHAFTTRFGGVSEGKFSTMNMSFSRGDNPDSVLENYKRICGAIGTDYRKCVLSQQTHTTNIKIVTEADAGKGIISDRDYNDIDGLITNVKGLTLVTQFADCVGLLFFDPVRKVIAASHAGWRGTVGKIGEKTVKMMQKHFNCNPADIKAAITPSICFNCFEVDSPVFEEFDKIAYIDRSKIIRDDGNGKYHINLWEANLQTLLLAGLLKENISVTDICTQCNPDYLFSHRYTKGERGNLAALIALK